jgi:hypothetical protein
MMNAAKATQPVHGVVSIGALGEVEELCRLLLDMMTPSVQA